MADITETTDDRALEALRFRANKETTLTAQEDELALEEVAEFIHVSAEGVQSDNLRSLLRDMANAILQNKAALARGEAQQPQAAQPDVGAQGLPPEQPQF